MFARSLSLDLLLCRNRLWANAVCRRSVPCPILSGQFTRHSEPGECRPDTAVGKTIGYIEAHYRERISLEDVLPLAGYSKNHFMRLFKAETGMSFIDYVNKYRIERCSLELFYGSRGISEIATDNGFANVQYFSRVFKAIMHNTILP